MSGARLRVGITPISEEVDVDFRDLKLLSDFEKPKEMDDMRVLGIVSKDVYAPMADKLFLPLRHR